MLTKRHFHSSACIAKGLALLLLLTTSPDAMAQHSITVQAGHAVPMGDLQNLGLRGAEISESTIGIGAEYAYRVNDLFVIEASGSYQNFGVDEEQFRNFYNNYQVTNKPEGNSVTTLMAGPAFFLASSPFEGRLGVQAGYMRLGLMSYSLSQQASTVSYGPETQSTIGYQAGLDLTYQLNEILGITLSSHILHGHFKEGIEFKASINPELEEISGPDNVSALQTMLGLSASFP